MNTDNSEAMRLADRISPETDWYEFDQVLWCNEAAALLRQQSERIAELEAERDRHQATATELISLLADIRKACGDNGKRMQPELVDFIGAMSTERDRLREEVERLKREKANAIDKAGHMLAAGRALSYCAFNLKQRVGEPLSTHDVAALESSQRAWDAALALARTTNKETE